MRALHLLTRRLPLLGPLASQQAAELLVRQTARKQWKLIATDLGSSFVQAFSEGATLGIIFLAVEVLSKPGSQEFDWSTNQLLAWWPSATCWLNSLTHTAVFIGLLAIAVLLQALQSTIRFVGLVSVGYFAARCRALVTTRIHAQILSDDFPCASS